MAEGRGRRGENGKEKKGRVRETKRKKEREAL